MSQELEDRPFRAVVPSVGLVFESPAGSLLRNGERVPVNAFEQEVLKLLFEADGDIVENETLKNVFGRKDLQPTREQRLNDCIARLKLKTGLLNRIQAVHGVGRKISAEYELTYLAEDQSLGSAGGSPESARSLADSGDRERSTGFTGHEDATARQARLARASGDAPAPDGRDTARPSEDLPQLMEHSGYRSRDSSASATSVGGGGSATTSSGRPVPNRLLVGVVAGLVVGLAALVAWLRTSEPPPPPPQPPPSIQITQVPTFRPQGGGSLEDIAGVVTVADASEYVVVVYACVELDDCYVQPLIGDGVRNIGSGGAWRSQTRGGSTYVAMIAASGFEPPPRIPNASFTLDGIIARTTVEGRR